MPGKFAHSADLLSRRGRTRLERRVLFPFGHLPSDDSFGDRTQPPCRQRACRRRANTFRSQQSCLLADAGARISNRADRGATDGWMGRCVAAEVVRGCGFACRARPSPGLPREGKRLACRAGATLARHRTARCPVLDSGRALTAAGGVAAWRSKLVPFAVTLGTWSDAP